MAVLTENGIELRTLTQIVDDNTTLWTQKTGDIDVAPSSAAGELIAIKSEVEARVDQDIAAAFLNNTIMATKEYLDLVGERKGVYRLANIPTVSIVSITGDNNTIIPEGSSFTSSTNSEIFTTQYQVVIVLGVAQVTVQSENYGVICPSETLSLTAPITGVTTATNLSNGIVGYETESDELYRLRIGSIGTEDTHIKDGLYFALLELNGVAKARVIDNNTDSSMFTEIPARYFSAIVLGGNETEIVNTVYNFTQNGNPSFGHNQKTVLSARGEPYIIFYSRAIEQPVTIDITITTDSNFDTFSGEGTITQNVVSLTENVKIGETLFLQKAESVCLIQGVTSVVVLMNGVLADIVPNYDTILTTNANLVSVS